MPRSTRSTCSGPSTGCPSRSPFRRSCRCTGSPRASTERSSSGSASPAGHPTSSRSSRQRVRRALRPSPSRTLPIRRWPARRSIRSTLPPVRSWRRRRPRRTPPSSSRSPRSRPRFPPRPTRNRSVAHPPSAARPSRMSPAALSAALAVEHDAAGLAEARRDLDQCTVLGRAFDYATAREWSLKLKELAQVHAEPYSTADFQHGPLGARRTGLPGPRGGAVGRRRVRPRRASCAACARSTRSTRWSSPTIPRSALPAVPRSSCRQASRSG